MLEANYRYKMMFSPDYKGVDVEQAMVDFKERILRYEEVYETITDRNIHYIKLINMWAQPRRCQIMPTLQLALLPPVFVAASPWGHLLGR